METKIRKTLKQWFPTAFEELPENDNCSDYEILCRFAKYTISIINEDNETKKEPFRLILLLYSKGSLYEKNAIENEFLRILAGEEKCMTLKEHLSLMPEELKPVYLKTILGN
ncbi:MAG TPA: hypothetical protein VK172_08480 [Lentimicrobium sp.]|nr:hypothetical protein [Bacteroidales bacterium]HLO91185.1 hypothetical protein [Lentimicrobium sp.]